MLPVRADQAVRRPDTDRRPGVAGWSGLARRPPLALGTRVATRPGNAAFAGDGRSIEMPAAFRILEEFSGVTVMSRGNERGRRLAQGKPAGVGSDKGDGHDIGAGVGAIVGAGFYDRREGQ